MTQLASLALAGPPAAACFHCGNPIPASRSDGFCCAGCRAVHRLLHESGLERYYSLRPARTTPLFNYFDQRASLQWLDQNPGMAKGCLELNIEGIQCAACVWAIEKLAGRQGGAAVRVNSALGRLSLRFDPARFDARRYLGVLADLGYRVQPLEEGFKDDSQGLLLRMGVCLTVSMNTLFFSIPIYLGLREDADGIYHLLRNLNFGLTVFSLIFGGSYFMVRAAKSLRQGIAHFDLPIALGVATAFCGSLWAHWHGFGGTIYFDSVNAFLTFMLVGRFMQERTLVHNRRRLFQSDAFSAGTVTVLDGRPRDIPYAQVLAGQTLLLQPGSLCPCPAQLLDAGPSEFDRAAVTGEARPVALVRDDTVAAGSRLVSASAVRVRTNSPFSGSLLAGLASAPATGEELPVLWRWAVRWYVLLVLAAAFGGWAFWMWRNPALAPKVFISTLVVTCPCGLGIAVPLARTLAERRLFAAGLTVRQPGLLERVPQVERICLDKTGTLTFSQLELANPAVLDRLGAEDRAALMGAAASSRHPVSLSLFHELSARGVAFPEDGSAVELPGQGVTWISAAGSWFLGRSMSEGGETGAARAVLKRDGALVASFDLEERVLSEAAESLRRLRAGGLDLILLSGDHPGRVAAMAGRLGLDASEHLGGLRAEDKARIAALRPSLMLGDGLNDGPALKAATVSGTPAWERTVVSDGADFSFNSGSLAWLPELFDTARDLRRAVWGNLAFAALYNLVLLAFSLRGLFSPLWCAVTMPAGSLLVIALTARAMRPGRVRASAARAAA
jgi:Cu2+-exporting ATPase